MAAFRSQYPEPEDPGASNLLPYFEPRSGQSITYQTSGPLDQIRHESGTYDDDNDNFDDDNADEEDSGVDLFPSRARIASRLPLQQMRDASFSGDSDDSDDLDSDLSSTSEASESDNSLNYPSRLEDLVTAHDDGSNREATASGHCSSAKRGRTRGAKGGRARASSRAASSSTRGRARGRARGRPRSAYSGQSKRTVPRGEGARGGGRGIPRGPKPPPDPGPEYHAIVNKANQAYLAQDWERVGELCNQLITINPAVWSAYGLMADVLREKGDKRGEYQTMFSALSVCKDVDAMWHMLRLAEDLEAAGDADVGTKEIISIYGALIDRDSNNVEARKGRMELFERAGLAGRAARECQKLVQLVPHDLDLLEHSARLALRTGTQETAIYQYEKTIQHLTEECVSGEESGFSFDDLNHYAELLLASKDYENGLIKVKQIARWISGRQDQTYWDDFQANDCEWDDYDEPRREAVPWFQGNQGEYTEDQYGMALPLELRAKLGLFRLQLGVNHYPEALHHFELIIDEDPQSYADILVEIANSLYDVRLYEESLRFFRSVMVTEYSGKHRLYIKVARASAIVGEREEATDYYERAISSFPGGEENEYRVEAARLYRELGQPHDAQRHADALLRKRAVHKSSTTRLSKSVPKPKTAQDNASGLLLDLDSVDAAQQKRPSRIDRAPRQPGQPKPPRVPRSGAQLQARETSLFARPPGLKYPVLPDEPRQYVDIAPRDGSGVSVLSQYVPVGGNAVEGDVSSDESSDENGGDDDDEDEEEEHDYPYLLEGILPNPKKIAARLAQTQTPRNVGSNRRRRREERKARPKGTSISAVRAKERVQKRQERLDYEERMRESVRTLYQQVEALEGAMAAGDEEAQDDWIIIVTKLLGYFRSIKAFYPRDRSVKFLGYSVEARARAKALHPDEPLTEAEWHAKEIYDSIGENIDYEAALEVPTHYEGVTFQEWLDLFCRLALLHAERGSLDDCFQVLSWAKEANVFRQDHVHMERLHLVGATCAVMLNSEQHLCEEPRYFLKTHQQMTDPFRLLAALNRIYEGEPSWYRGGPMQKFLLRQIKTMDYALLSDEQRTRFNFTEGEVYSYHKSGEGKKSQSAGARIGNPKGLTGLDPLPVYLYGEILGAGKGSSWQNSLYYFLRAQAIKPNEPLVLLSISVAYLVGATKRHVENRHQYVVQALAFLGEYKRFRMEDIETAARQNYTAADVVARRKTRLTHQRRMETTFNEARAWHFLGLLHLCIPAYEEVLAMRDLSDWKCEAGPTIGGTISVDATGQEHCIRMGINGGLDLLEEPDYKREAAFALQQIYALQGHMALARELGEKYLVF